MSFVSLKNHNVIASTLRQHVKSRASQRYGLEFTNADIANICALISIGRGRLIERQPGKRSLWDVCYQGRIVRVVYDDTFKTLVTVLPNNRRDAVEI